jgi:hypothetical protein
MKTHQKFLIVYLVFLIILLPSCVTIHETSTSNPTMCVEEAIDSIKKSIKDTVQDPFWGHMKVVADIAVSEDDITLINADNTKRNYPFNKLTDPTVIQNNLNQLYGIQLTQTPLDVVLFSNSKSAIMFADALYYLKHIDIKMEREKEREDCLRQIRQTPIDLFLAGATSNELNLHCFNQGAMESFESVINNILIEWRDRGLLGRLQKSTSSQLSDLVIKMEKGIFKLDHQIQKAKDIVDENANQITPAKGSAMVLSLAHLLEQRKTILEDMLGTVKQAASQGAASGG